MTLPPDPSFETLEAVWRSAEWPVPPTDAVARRLAEQVRRGSRRMRFTVAGEVIVTVLVFVLVGAAAPPATSGAGPIIWLLAVAHTALLWGFVIWNRRGLWHPVALETSAYLALLRTRARRRRRAARFATALLVTEVAATVVAVVVMAGGDLGAWFAGHGLWTLMIVALFAGVGAAVVWLNASARRQLSRLAEIERAVS